MTSSTLPLPPNLVRKSGAQVSTEHVLEATPVLAFYFSAHWCPPCRQFTPVLAQVFELAMKIKDVCDMNLRAKFVDMDTFSVMISSFVLSVKH